MLLRLLVFCVCILACGNSWAIEIFRNGEAYSFNLSLPYGGEFENIGIDRKFDIKGVQGNLRLIQDTYNSCSQLVAERQTNKSQEGFTEVLSKKVTTKDCAIKLKNPDTGEVVSSFYIYMFNCKCFVAMQIAGEGSSSNMRSEITQNVLDQLRSHNPAEADWSTKNADYEILTCQQKRERGMRAEENEIDHCGLNQLRTKKRPTKLETGLNEKLKKELEEQNRIKLQQQALLLQRERDKEQRKIDARLRKKQQQKSENTVTVWVQNSSFNPAQIRYFRYSNRRVFWPGNGASYSLFNDGTSRSVTLSCKKGEKICYGAWADVNDTFYWGLGKAGEESCENCCFYCGDGNVSYNLIADKKATPKSRPSRGLDPEAVGLALQGITLGLQRYNSNKGYSGGGNSCGGRCSGISGLD